MKADTSSDTFKALKRKARAVKARPRRKAGGRGSAQAPGPETPIDSPASKNIPEKEVAQLPQEAPATPESQWRQQGQLEVLVYCRPVNPRLLLIRSDNGENGRVAVRPDLQSRFGVGRRIWVKPTPKPGFYELAGTYTMWGKRVE